MKYAAITEHVDGVYVQECTANGRLISGPELAYFSCSEHENPLQAAKDWCFEYGYTYQSPTSD